MPAIAVPTVHTPEPCIRMMPSSLNMFASAFNSACDFAIAIHGQVPRTEDRTPMQGLASTLFGRLIFSFGSGGSRGAPFGVITPPGGFGTIADVRRLMC